MFFEQGELAVALNIKIRDVEKLPDEVVELTGESKTEAVVGATAAIGVAAVYRPHITQSTRLW